MQVLAVADPDRGVCGDGLSPCNITAQNCPDGSVCALDAEYTCNNLVPIACNDDSETCACNGFPEPKLSELCMTNLTPGEMYFVLLASKTEDDSSVLRLHVTSPCTADAPPLHNDLCVNAEPHTGGFPEPLVIPFDLSGASYGEAPATFDCPGPHCEGYAPSSISSDAWFDWIAPCNGEVRMGTCPNEGDKAYLTIYEGHDCPVGQDSELSCPVWNKACFGGYFAGFAANKDAPYLIRLMGLDGDVPAGDLTISITCDAPPYLEWFDPPSGVVDARRPHPPDAPDQGEGIQTFETLMPETGIPPADCWIVSETAIDGERNRIHAIALNAPALTLELARPITPGAATGISYFDEIGLLQGGRFISHPGNVNGDDTAGADDVFFLMEVLTGNQIPPWGEYSTDCDHSGKTTPADILCLVDLLNGAGSKPWLDTPNPAIDLIVFPACGGIAGFGCPAGLGCERPWNDPCFDCFGVCTNESVPFCP